MPTGQDSNYGMYMYMQTATCYWNLASRGVATLLSNPGWGVLRLRSDGGVRPKLTNPYPLLKVKFDTFLRVFK